MSNRSYSLRFEGLAAPDGEIPFRDLAEIGSALQLVATRIARQLGGQEGRGRSAAVVDRMSEVRLTGLTSGSTVLELRVGDDGALELPGGDEDVVATRLEEALSGLADNARPSWASAGVVSAIGKIAAGVTASGAKRITASRGLGPSAVPWRVIDVGKVDVGVWRVAEARETERVSMTGRLDKVDLRARRFRVRDDVGHDVTLEDVVDLASAALLIGQRVIASGVAERERGRVVRIVEPTLQPEQLPPAWFAAVPSGPPIGAVLSVGGIPGVSEQEVDEFLAEIRG